MTDEKAEEIAHSLVQMGKRIQAIGLIVKLREDLMKVDLSLKDAQDLLSLSLMELYNTMGAAKAEQIKIAQLQQELLKQAGVI